MKRIGDTLIFREEEIYDRFFNALETMYEEEKMNLPKGPGADFSVVAYYKGRAEAFRELLQINKRR